MNRRSREADESVERATTWTSHQLGYLFPRAPYYPWMQWDELYATGFAQIDQQHQTIFKSVGDLRRAIESDDGAAAYAQALAFLDRYSRDHFGLEERCMAKHRCPAAQVNKAQHEAMTQLLAEHRRLHTAHGYDNHDAHILVNALEHWLHNHICRVDRQLRHCVADGTI
ncbi:MAG: bacteriohemerythrin [Gemmatimonadetes bacterium]|nr:bacteriohemerythrin [Gemmatimonadota bacterium]